MSSTFQQVAEKPDKNLVKIGIFWNFIQLFVNQSLSFVLKLVLAKLLFPSQFGVIGMATVFIGFIQVINDLGFGAALVQRPREKLAKEHFNTAFWTGIIWGCLLFLIMTVAIAPMASIYYKEPVLKTIIPFLSIGILVSPVNLVHKAQLTRKMNFRKLGFIDNTSNIVAGILAIVLAFNGAGVWSLVVNSVASTFIAVPLLFKATGWAPQLSWSNTAFKDIFGFGIYTTGSNILSYLYNNIDYLLIGKLLGAVSLGVYTLSFVLTDTFRSKIMSVINTVMFPFYGKNQHDPNSLKKYYLKVIQFNSLVIYPVMVFFISLGEPFIVSFFGSKWIDTVVPLQILSVSVMFHIMVSGNSALIRGLGLSRLEMKLQLIKAFIFIPMLAIAIIYYGMVGAALAILLNKIIAVAIAQYTFQKLLPVKISTDAFLRSLAVPGLASGIGIVTAYLFAALGCHYMISAIGLALSYSVTVWLFMKDELRLLITQTRI